MTDYKGWRKPGGHLHLPTLASRDDLKYARLSVENRNTGFEEGKEFRISYEYSVAAIPTVLRVTSTTDFIILIQSIGCDNEGVRFTAYRQEQGVAGGAFDEVVPIYKNNFASFSKDLDPVISIDTNGTFTPNPSEPSVETIRVRTAGGTGQSITVGRSSQGVRGLPANVYYLILERITTSGTAQGVYDLLWEEVRPSE